MKLLPLFIALLATYPALSNTLLCEQAVRAMAALRQEGFAEHPDRIAEDQLKPGDKVWISPSSLPNYMRSRFSEPLEITFVGKKILDHKKTVLKKNRKTFEWEKVRKKHWKTYNVYYYWHPETGSFPITFGGEIFSHPKFESHSVYSRGDQIELSNWTREFDGIFPLSDPRPVTLSKYSEGRSLKYVRQIRPKMHLVQLTSRSDHLSSKPIAIANFRISALPFGNRVRAEASLKPIQELSLAFEKQEIVRYRDKDGAMQMGFVEKITGDEVSLYGVEESVPLAKVFKSVGYLDAKTPSIAEKWIPTAEHLPTYTNDPKGLAKEFLDAGAKLTSLLDFRSEPQKSLNVVYEFARTSLDSTKQAGFGLEESNLRNMDQILCTGAGICRHHATFLAGIFSEAGFSFRMVYRTDPEKTYTTAEKEKLSKLREKLHSLKKALVLPVTSSRNSKEYKAYQKQTGRIATIEEEILGSGHVWIEVDMQLADGKMKTFIVDPTIGVMSSLEALTRLEIREGDLQSKNSYALYRKYYLAPDRKYYIPD